MRDEWSLNDEIYSRQVTPLLWQIGRVMPAAYTLRNQDVKEEGEEEEEKSNHGFYTRYAEHPCIALQKSSTDVVEVCWGFAYWFWYTLCTHPRFRGVYTGGFIPMIMGFFINQVQNNSVNVEHARRKAVNLRYFTDKSKHAVYFMQTDKINEQRVNAYRARGSML